ncbi:unnamed protein product [Allacma fusca]|uniref:Uncharacterized protein n=1 Tax=Allacma fusca TaxID=39272 RepID=A0A8J2JKK4_9HEXA|nr:unnamed protein product [Allacma fusca]
MTISLQTEDMADREVECKLWTVSLQVLVMILGSTDSSQKMAGSEIPLLKICLTLAFLTFHFERYHFLHHKPTHDRKNHAEGSSTQLEERKAPFFSEDLTLVEAGPFQIMVCNGNQTCIIKYIGPSNSILWKENACVFAVNLKQHVQFDLVQSLT